MLEKALKTQVVTVLAGLSEMGSGERIRNLVMLALTDLPKQDKIVNGISWTGRPVEMARQMVLNTESVRDADGVPYLAPILEVAVESVRTDEDEQVLRDAIRVLQRQGTGGSVEMPAAVVSSPTARQVRQVVETLARDAYGVAVMEPLGFRGEDILRAAAKMVPDSNIVVRLVPRPGTQDPARLFRPLLRDLAHGLESSLGERYAVVAKRFPARGIAVDELTFEETVEDVVRDLRSMGQDLVLMMTSLGRVEHVLLRSLGYLLVRLSDQGLKVMATGGWALHRLRTEPGFEGTSAWHHLSVLKALPWDETEVEKRVREASVTLDVGRIMTATEGHPALVMALIAAVRNGEDVSDCDAALLRSEQADRLRHLLRSHPPALQSYHQWVGAGPRMQDVETEQRLKWWGLVREAGNGWRWTAPVMGRLGVK